jgi:hypothetical protein
LPRAVHRELEDVEAVVVAGHVVGLLLCHDSDDRDE